MPRGGRRAVRVAALVPAHDEQGTIGPCLDHLSVQTRPPDFVTVVADNCSDGTEGIARERLVEVARTTGNRHKKAGALNEILPWLLAFLGRDDAVLIVDADSYLDPGFVKEAERWLERGYDAVGGTFRGRPEGTYVSFCEASEYARYARDTAKIGGKALTLSGTAMLVRASALRRVAASRKGGEVYSTTTLTEDLELSVRILNLGMSFVAPPACTLTTEVMGGWRSLFKQRLRWREGAVRTALEYGFVRGTRELWLRLLWGLVGVSATAAYLGLLVCALAAGHPSTSAFWLGVTAVFALEQAVTVLRFGGWRRALVGATLLFEMPYLLFLQGVCGAAYVRAFGRGDRQW